MSSWKSVRFSWNINPRKLKVLVFLSQDDSNLQCFRDVERNHYGAVAVNSNTNI